ncbi:MAG: endo-1,3-alpha-glucanase family glycosylhydrolase [Chloroflexi bacterium]|nr:endo-1,3-alpha-glucanase family glycosylhydrolase [Chloroflexota bacterium]
MKRLLLPLILLLLTLLVGRQPAPTAAQGRTGLVLAHYYAWFSPSSFGAGKTPFNPPSPYFSTDTGIIQRHVSEAQGAGIDGFVQAWYGPDASQQTEPNFAALLNIASGSGFKAAVNFEPISAFMPNNDVRGNALATLLATHATHPAYLRMDGKPVIFFWATWALTLGDWEYIRNIADPNRNSIWIAEGGNTQYLGVFDGMYLYNIAWSADPAGINISRGGQTRAATETYGAYKYWVGTAMPGFDDSLLGRGTNSIIRNRSEGAYYRNSFSGAAQSGPDLIVITSYNEWPEGSNIEPSNEFGTFYMDLTRELIATYKAGGIPSAAPLPTAPNQSGGSGTAVPTLPPGTPLPTNTPAPTSTPIPPPTPWPDGRIVHLIASGETLISVAVRYNLTLDQLYEWNNLNSASLLSIGQEIIIGYDAGIVSATVQAQAQLTPTPTTTPSVLDGYPGATIREADGAIVYEIKLGNTAIEVAILYNLTLEELYTLNGLTGESVLSVGQLVVVGYVPLPDEVGGSADLPVPLPTNTPLPPPSPTPTFTPIPPTETPVPTAVSSFPTAMPPTATAVPPAIASSADASPTTNLFLMFLGAVVLLLAGLGGLFLYLGRR